MLGIESKITTISNAADSDVITCANEDVTLSPRASSFRLLDASNINQLQKLYPEIVNELNEAFSRLKQPQFTWRMGKAEERHILEALASLMPLVTVKSSIFLLRGLQPTLFALLFETLPLSDAWLIQNASNCHLMILQLAFSYAQTHEYFATSSSLFKDSINITAVHSSSSFEQLTSKYFTRILAATAELLPNFHMLSAQAQSLTVDWLQRLTVLVADKLFIVEKLRIAMLGLLFELHQFKSPEQRKQFVKCMYRLQVFDLLLQKNDQKCRQLTTNFIDRLIQAADQLSSDQFRIVWTRTPITFLIKLFGLIDSQRMNFDKNAIIPALLPNKEPLQLQLGQLGLETFEFEMIANFLFERKPICLVLDESTVNDWIQPAAEFLYWNLQHSAFPTIGSNKLDEEKHHQTTTLQRWQLIIGQLALFCIVNRMRTPVGRNPVETFTKFENGLRSLVAQVALRKSITLKQQAEKIKRSVELSNAEEQEDERESLASPARHIQAERHLRSEEDWFRVRMLLHSIDQLDKLMSFAVRGSALDIANEIPIISRQFFLVNQTSCTDWLSRTALPLMCVAFSSGNYAQIVRIAGFLFAEFERKNPSSGAPIRLDSSTLFAMCWLVRALVELGAPQAILGVQKWAENMFGTQKQSFEWLKYAELLAAAKVEEALNGFLFIQEQHRMAITESPPPEITNGEIDGECASKKVKMHDHVVKAVEEMAWRASSILRNPQIAQTLYDAYAHKRIAITSSTDDNTSESFKQFKRVQWQRVIALSSWDQIGASNMNFIEPSAEHKFLPWEQRGRLVDAEAEILRLFELRQRKEFAVPGRMNTSEALFALQDDLSDSAQLLLLGGTERTDGLDHARFAFLHALCTGIQHLQQQRGHYVPPHKQQQHQRSPIKQQLGSGGLPILLEFNFTEFLRDWKSETLHRLELAQSYCSWMERLYGGQKEHSPILRKMHHDMAQLAKESGNANLADLHYRMAGIVGMGGGTDIGNNFALSNDIYIGSSDDHSQFDAFSSEFLPQTPPPPGFSQFPPGYNSGFVSLAASGISISTAQPQFNAQPSDTLQSHQVLLSEEFDGDTLKLLPGEMAAMLQFGINICTEQGRKLETFIGELAVYEEFCAKITDTFPLTDILAAPILSAIGFPTFQQLWLQIKHRQYRLYELALNSHLRFLENLFPGKSHCQTMEVLLRLLKMLRRQPEWFIRIVSVSNGDANAWMERIPVDVWTGVVAQLFALLDHRSGIVRSVISFLLDHVGHHQPHAICYPAIVIAEQADDGGEDLDIFGISNKHRAGAQDNTEMESLAEEDLTAGIREFQIGDDHSAKERKEKQFIKYCRSLVNSLSGSHPQLVSDTRAFCKALQKIALMHEEQWLYVLGQFDAQLGRLFRTLAVPLQQIQQNGDIDSQQKHVQRVQAYMEKVIASLNSLYTSTCSPNQLESEYDRQFATAFGEQIKAALATLEQFTKEGNLRKAWEPFKKILSALNKQAMKRTAQSLSVQKMSPFLGELTSTAVPMPGQEQSAYSEVVSVQKMVKVAYVLPTKTRPKKIAFVGSDGKTYTFLFKGQESLVMDTRLMQLLQVCNAIFADAKNQRQMDTRPPYQCITYSVTPLGQRSGLIQWVDGAIPLFQIYRKWHVRRSKFLAELEENKQQKLAAIAQQQQKGTSSGHRGGLINIGGAANKKSENAEKKPQKEEKPAQPQESERPIEQFHEKLKAIFATNGIPKEQLADRQRWPRKMVKKVIGELIGETPRDILAQELWMHSGTSSAWWEQTQRFARTAAVSSMLGALIGLGDRHLDNVLVNLTNGQIVHVDYNVCFEKGRALRVPERVPFRLTGNIVHALGPTKIEGIYRHSCERVMEMLREDKQIILLLLDTLKYDPLLDFSFLHGVVDITGKEQSMIASEVAHRIHRKLLGHEMVQNREAKEAQQQQTSGMLKLAVLEAMGAKEGEKKPSKVGTASSIFGRLDWVETEQMSVAEQVDLLIREASDLNNLALMYEGWTAWV